LQIHHGNFKSSPLRYTRFENGHTHDEINVEAEFSNVEDLNAMASMTIEMPDSALAAMRQDSVGFASEMRLAAAVKWYELRKVSQGRAAEIAGISRAEFVVALGRFGVSPFQATAEEILREAAGV
jgi:predicted HTH domain antitoxin